MTTLATKNRDQLGRVITAAREVAETGARAALEALAVHHHEFYRHMTPDEQKLRKRLRAHGQQLGDHYDSKKGTQAIDHLVNECAYEHWHRMLFARFLAENDLLIEPEMGVAISLEECEDLAKEQKIDPWVLASRYAQQMLPQIFRPDDPVLQVTFAREHLLKLERLLESLEPEVFTASDSIGWVYQFWQSKKKKEVNDSGIKIGADELPSVTQLFTEPYMVSFLIHNTLGAWYAGKVFAKNPELARNARSEDELRSALALPGVTWDYLRFIRNQPSPSTGAERGDGIWQPAAGTFDGWPRKTAELKVLDPCCGSGHFLVAVFLCLVALRMAEERLSTREACDAVLRDNIFGLEIDERCCQIAAFALALAAWTYSEASGYRPLPELHIACTGIGPQATEEQWLKLAEKFGMPTQTDEQERVKNGLLNLHRLFSQAPTLGSLINPKKLQSGVFEADYETIQPYLSAVLKAEKADDETHEQTIAAAGMVKAAELLASEYALIVTNVPYLTRGKQTDTLKDFIALHHSDARQDLATAFLDRALTFAQRTAALGIVCPQNWLSLPAYSALRKRLLKTRRLDVLAKLGPGAFGTISGEVVNVALMSIAAVTPPSGHRYGGVDASISTAEIPQKAEALVKSAWRTVAQSDAIDGPDARITLEARGRVPVLGKYANAPQGIKTGDDGRFRRNWWELPYFDHRWRPFQGTPEADGFAGGMRYALDWSDDGHAFARLQGIAAWGKSGVVVKLMGDFSFSLYHGELFDSNVTAIVPNREDLIEPVWAFCLSPTFREALSTLEDGIKVNNATTVKVPFELAHWQKVAAEKFPDGLPEPESDDPTQWLFHGHPCEAKKEMMLQVAIARLLGYRWPGELDDKMRLSNRAQTLVKQCAKLAKLADNDGIVCIPSIRGEDVAEDRLRQLLAAAYGDEWSPAKERELVTAAQAQDLDDWLRNSFFEQHCQLFHHRPFIWHIWDGRKRDGFHALVNYHKLAEGGGKGRQLLEKLTYGYLGDWIILQKDGVKNGVGGADDRLASALELEKRLKTILEGEPPFDIFVRWKQIEKQPIGWEPDINDGVRMNIRPFMADDIPGGKRGAGILRWKPNIKWEKDRGKDVASAPWFDLGPQYGGHPGDRINDHHLTCEEKRKAREAMEKNKEKKA